MRLLKAVRVRDGVKSSHTFDCKHFTINELPDEFRIEFPQEGDDGRDHIKVISLPEDYDAIYHMSPLNGDTLDSWTWEGETGRARKVDHRG